MLKLLERRWGASRPIDRASGDHKPTVSVVRLVITAYAIDECRPKAGSPAHRVASVRPLLTPFLL